MRLLITGGCGFLGSNLARAAILRGDDLLVMDNLSRAGGEDNLRWLKSQGSFAFKKADTRSLGEVEEIMGDFRPQAVFHLAAQVAMTSSLADPRRDFDVNVVGGMNVLDAARRKAPEAALVYSSTNKVYGAFRGIAFDELETRYAARGYAEGFDESLPLDFESPYGCSKGAIDQYMLDYHRQFSLRTVVLRHSSIYGGRQFSTFDQGWIGWFVSQALAAASGASDGMISVAGTGKQVRDVLFASDAVECYFSAVREIDKTAGQAFNIGGGMPNSLSIIELLGLLGDALNVRLGVKPGPWRAGDQKVFVANAAKAERSFGWKPRVGAREGLERTLEWVRTIERRD